MKAFRQTPTFAGRQCHGRRTTAVPDNGHARLFCVRQGTPRFSSRSPNERASARATCACRVELTSIERRGDSAALVLNTPDSLKKFVVCFANNNSAQNITMTAEIFCC